MWKMAAIIAAGAINIAAAPVRNVADLSWLSGTWLSETKEGWTEEVWTSTRGDMMLGTNRSGKGERASAFEFMRIAPDGLGRISFWASPGGKTPVAFPMISSKAGEIVFENPKNDYPTRIVYRRKGPTLEATISGPEGKNPLSWTFRKP
jgi:hypothetical protein